MYNINDMILYGTHGACKIIDIAEQTFTGTTGSYYVLKPISNDSSTIYVSVLSKDLDKRIRRILSSDEIHRIIKMMPRENTLWIEDENERKRTYKESIERGDRTDLVQIIKALYTHQKLQQGKGKKLHVSDENFLKDAEKMLYNEFAIVLNIKPEQVLPFIMQQIEADEKAVLH